MKKYSFSCVAPAQSANDPENADMLQFLESFDPVEKKYNFRGFPLTPDARAKASEFEDSYQFGNLTKQRFSNIVDNLKLVYWDSRIIEKDVKAFYLVERKIIHQYFAIPQLDRLFDEDYFNFEWDMHVGQNFSEHRNEYYRDHFIHQIRDMYMMVVMLDRFGVYNAACSVMKDPSVGKISEYTFKKWEQFRLNRMLPQRSVLKEMFQDINPTGTLDEEKYNEEYFFHYVIYASAMLSALFHDMGYPVCHFLETRHRLSEYNPFVYMFTHNAVDSFDQLAAKLSDSLLFTIVSTKEIKQSLQLNKKGRYNHGAYSAIAFLLQFYENGIQYSLSPEKQCAIELAAVAIYNHTAKYDIVKYDPANSYCQPIFAQNPVSFLLRFCDDLQEWDRRYFEISSASDFIFCDKCKTPMLKVLNQPGDHYYQCFCGKKYPRPDSFVKRKLYLVSVADSVTMYLDDAQNKKDAGDKKDTENKKEKELVVELNYDLYRLLMLSYINNMYAKFRANELEELKLLVSCQDYWFQTDEKLEFSHISIRYYMSENPILIKLWILDRFLQKNSSIDTADALLDHFKKCYDNDDGDQKECLKKHFEFYLSLRKLCESDNENGLKTLCNTWQVGDQDYDAALRCLIFDCFKKFHNTLTGSSDKKLVQNVSLTRAVSLFNDQRSRCNNYTELLRKNYLNFFFDMYFFYRMNEDLKA